MALPFDPIRQPANGFLTKNFKDKVGLDDILILAESWFFNLFIEKMCGKLGKKDKGVKYAIDMGEIYQQEKKIECRFKTMWKCPKD